MPALTTKTLIRIARDLGQQQADLDIERLGCCRDSVDFKQERRDWRASAAQAGDGLTVVWADEVAARATSTQDKVARAYLTAYRGS